MTKDKSYIKLVHTEQGYEIYAINKGQKTKLSKQQKIIMTRVLKKFAPIKKDNTYIYPNYKLITLNFLKEKLLSKHKKVNRNKSKNILPGVAFVASASLMVYLFMAKFSQRNKEPQKESSKDPFSIVEVLEEPIPPNVVQTETSTVETTIPEIIEFSTGILKFEYDFETPSDKQTYDNSSTYMDTYLKYEKIYGVDARILCAIGAQESSGIHHEESINGGYAVGIMGIENIWADSDLRVFNFETNSYETIKIDYSKIGNLDYNIKIGAAIFQNYFYGTLNNVTSIPEEEFLAYTLQKYNMGPGNMSKILKLGPNWMDNREVINGGDKLYVEHVLSRLDNDTTLKMRLTDGSYYETTITNKALEIKHART